MSQHACSGMVQTGCGELTSARQTLSLMCWTYRDVPVSQARRATITSVRTKHLSGTVIRERSSAGTGPALWSPDGADGDRQYLRPGRGAGLFLIDGDGIAPVTHPAASGHYSELKQPAAPWPASWPDDLLMPPPPALPGGGDRARTGRPAQAVTHAACRLPAGDQAARQSQPPHASRLTS